MTERMTAAQYRQEKRICLPWPNKRLSPNARVHRMEKARLVSRYKAECGWTMKEHGIRPIDAAALNVRITFHEPDNRVRDMDNMLASIKAGLDAVSIAIGVDDSKWTLTLVRGEVSRPHGKIIVELEAI